MLRDIAPYVAMAAAALSLALLIVVIVMWVRLRRVRRAQVVVMGRHEQRDIVEEVGSLDSQVRNLREAVEILTDQLDEHKAHLDRALTRRAIVRYDAFRDSGGEQSASFALLDDYRSGVVFSAIAARDFARIYVKHLDHGVADRELSPEERQVVAAAVPRPLGPGEDGARAARAPKSAGVPRPPAAAAEPDALETASAAPGPASGAAAHAAAPATGSSQGQPGPDGARRAFESLAEVEAAPADGDEFTWESGVPPRSPGRGPAPADPGPAPAGPGPGADGGDAGGRQA